MPSDLDICRSAKQFGANTPIRAAIRADRMLDIGELDSLAVWRRIKAVIEELLNETPGGVAH